MNSIKKVNISINTTEKYLEQVGASVEDLQNAIEYLAGCFGTKYQRMFPTKIGSNDTDRILYAVNILKK